MILRRKGEKEEKEEKKMENIYEDVSDVIVHGVD